MEATAGSPDTILVKASNVFFIIAFIDVLLHFGPVQGVVVSLFIWVYAVKHARICII